MTSALGRPPDPAPPVPKSQQKHEPRESRWLLRSVIFLLCVIAVGGPAALVVIAGEAVAFRVPRGTVVDVHLKPPAAAGEDMARQMLTTMSTLVVAIASFYFGSSSVQQALGGTAGGSGSPSLTLLEPLFMPRTLRRKAQGGWEPETIRLRGSPPGARVKGSVEGDEASTLAAVDDSGKYTYTPTQPAPEGVTRPKRSPAPGLFAQPSEMTSQILWA